MIGLRQGRQVADTASWWSQQYTTNGGMCVYDAQIRFRVSEGVVGDSGGGSSGMLTMLPMKGDHGARRGTLSEDP